MTKIGLRAAALGILLQLAAVSGSISDVRLENLARCTATVASASSVNGDGPLDDPYHGVPNLFDGRRHIIDGTNYTYWLSEPFDEPWILVRLPGPATVHTVLVEFGALDPPAAAYQIRNPDLCSLCAPNVVRQDRPQEFAVDLILKTRRGERVRKLPSVNVTGFRHLYRLDDPVSDVVGVRVVFPGPITVKVAELEILGRLEDADLCEEGPPGVVTGP